MNIKQALCALTLCVSIPTLAHAQQPAVPAPAAPTAPEISAPAPQTAGINGTVTDVGGSAVPGATIVANSETGAAAGTAKANADGFFAIHGLAPGIYHLVITMKDFTTWNSDVLTLAPGQDLDVPGIKMQVGSAFTVTALYTPVQIATQEVHVEEEQRVFGVIPNFYVVYDSSGVPLTAKLKFELAMKSSIDPVTFGGVLFYAGINQAAHRPNYVGNDVGYGQRVGAFYADGLTDILFGGAILPSILHQDPRYFYMGPDRGTKKQRFWYAVRTPFVCKGDNGKWQPNYSSIGGDLISGSLSNLYYPQSDRGVGLVFSSAAIGAGGRAVVALAQEFVLRKLTTTRQKKPKN